MCLTPAGDSVRERTVTIGERAKALEPAMSSPSRPAAGSGRAWAIALFSLRAMRATDQDPPHPAAQRQARYLGWLTVVSAIALWLTVLAGTYISFPDYRATPPEGTVDLAPSPGSLIQSSADTAWLHSFAMEIKEHVPWIAAILATAVAFIAVLLGIFINKVAPLE